HTATRGRRGGNRRGRRMQPSLARHQGKTRNPSPATATPRQAERRAATEGQSTMVLAQRPVMENNGRVIDGTSGGRGRTGTGSTGQPAGLTARQAALNQIANQRVA